MIRHFHAARYWRPIDFSPMAESIWADLEAGLFNNLAALGKGAAAEGIPLVVCSVAHPDPDMLSHDEAAYVDFLARNQWTEPYMGLSRYLEYIERLNSRLESLASEEGHPFIPVASHLRGGLEVFGDICHMHDDGIALKAEIIFRYLVGK